MILSRHHFVVVRSFLVSLRAAYLYPFVKDLGFLFGFMYPPYICGSAYQLRRLPQNAIKAALTLLSSSHVNTLGIPLKARTAAPVHPFFWLGEDAPPIAKTLQGAAPNRCKTRGIRQ